MKIGKKTNSTRVLVALSRRLKKKKKNSTSAHGKIRVAEEPILVWLHFISAASNDTMILDCQALMRGKKKSLLKSPQ